MPARQDKQSAPVGRVIVQVSIPRGSDLDLLERKARKAGKRLSTYLREAAVAYASAHAA